MMTSRSDQRRGTEIGLPFSRWLRRLEGSVVLSDDDRAAVSALPIAVRYLSPGQAYARAGDVASHCCLILDGFLYRQRGTGSGRRQIVNIHVPGDLVDLETLRLPRFDHDVSAVGTTVVGVISHAALESMLHASPRLHDLIWRETLIQASVLREWIVSLGQRSAMARVAHILCEVSLRLRAVELGRDLGINIPWTQSDLADAAGISTVHANRVVQELRRTGAIAWESSVVQILDWQLLAEIGDFSPDYLHLGDNLAGDEAGLPRATAGQERNDG